MNKLLFLFLLPITVLAQENKNPTINQYMQAQHNVKQFSGAVLVVQKGKLLYEKAFGEADREWNVPNTTSTKFKIGSNTKQFTAACVLKLAEDGKLGLDDKLSKYFPDYPKGDSVTIHHLLSHTSGIANYTDLDEFWDKPAFLRLEHDTLIAFFKNKPFDFSPGAKCSYSNSGYYLLGRIIEKASGEDYADYLEKNIITAAKLLNTKIDNPNTILPFRARGYYQRKNTFYNAGYIAIENIWSAGALYSTIGDLYLWTKALHENKIINSASVKKMTTPHGITTGKEKFGYGLIIDSIANHPRIWHDGSIPGFTSCISFYPQDDVYIIALSNNSFSTGDIVKGLSHLVFGLPIELPYIHKEIKLAENLLDKFVGKYEGATLFEIIKREGKLYRKTSSGAETALKPESENKLFFDDDSDRQLVFIFNADNTVSKVFIVASGISTEIKKAE
jgi:CubicO group peptidase (beta-lactamase class C family)